MKYALNLFSTSLVAISISSFSGAASASPRLQLGPDTTAAVNRYLSNSDPSFRVCIRIALLNRIRYWSYICRTTTNPDTCISYWIDRGGCDGVGNGGGRNGVCDGN